MEIVDLLLHGRSPEYIHEVLFISRSTVNTHIKHIYRKIGVHSKQEMIDLFEQVHGL